MKTIDLQFTLQRAGFNPGPVDGVPGRLTTAAVIAFQRAKGLEPDGIVGPATLRALAAVARAPRAIASASRAADAGRSMTPWLEVAYSLKGLKEAPGAANNATILDWARKLGGWIAPWYVARGDATPWCGLFVAHTIATALPAEPLPQNPLSALAWATWGVPLANPTVGAVMVKKRTGGGHVFEYIGEDDRHYYGIGGNQSDSVSVQAFKKADVIAIRWPSTVPVPATSHRPRMVGGVLSTKED